MKCDNTDGAIEAAHQIRANISAWFCAEGSDRVILAPATLISLRLFMGFIHVRKLLMTSGEYYGPLHFPGIQTQCCDPKDITSIAELEKPDAVLMSVVTWRGQVLDVRGTFGKIAKARTGPKPILIADYAHAGAIGFPEIAGLKADLTVGDLGKWVLPPGIGGNVSFFHASNDALQKLLVEIFRPFFLATNESLDNSARWVPASEIITVARWMKRNPMQRRDLLFQYRRNRKLASILAGSKRLSDFNCIVWTNKKCDIMQRLARQGLVWRRRDGNRVLCRDLGNTPTKKRAANRSQLEIAQKHSAKSRRPTRKEKP